MEIAQKLAIMTTVPMARSPRVRRPVPLHSPRKTPISVEKKMVDAITKEYPELSRVWLLTGEGDMLKSVKVEGSGNATVNGDHSTATIGVDGSRLLDQLDRKDEQIRNSTEQVNRLLAIIERMQGV